MAELKKLLGKRISEIRKLRKLKQEKLAELIGIATRNMSNIETGRCFPSPENIEKLAKALNCKIKDLFDFEHQQEDKDLIATIYKKINEVDHSRLQDLYKITKALTDL